MKDLEEAMMRHHSHACAHLGNLQREPSDTKYDIGFSRIQQPALPI
jgi:hypothetical protein